MSEQMQRRDQTERPMWGRLGIVLLLVGAVLFLAAAPAAPAYADVLRATWTGGNNAAWDDADNWSTANWPQNSLATQYEVVIGDQTAGAEGPYLPDGRNIAVNKLTINDSDGFVELRDGAGLELKNSGGLNSQGTITVKAGGRLTLNGGTITSKKIVLEGITGTAKKARLRLNSDTTLSAPLSGAVIVGSDPDDTSGAGCIGCPGPARQDPDGLIEGDGKLTLGTAGTIHGELEIRVGLVNNGLVDADVSAGKVFLSTTSKSGGSGADFKATKGLLDVGVNVTGTADWTVQESGFLLVDGGDISGTALKVLKVNDTNPSLFVVSQTVTLGGNLDVTMTGGNVGEYCSDDGANPQWRWTGSAACKFTGGTENNPVTIEVAAVDKCHVGWDWDLAWSYDCMGMGTEVIIGADAHLKLVDNHDNENTGGNHCNEECFFVLKLTFVDTDGTLDTNGRDAHYNTLTGNVSQILGSQSCGDCP